MRTFAVLGLGKFGSAVAVKLFNMGYEVLAIDNDMEKVNAISDSVTQAVKGDVKSEEVLRAMGIRNYDCAVVAVGNISDSILATLILKEMGVPKIICKAENRNHEKVLQKIGADSVVIPEYETGIKTAVSLVSNHVMDFIDLSDKYGIIDIKVPDKWIEHSIRSLKIREKYGINIIAIKNRLDSESVTISPNPDYIFTGDDIVVFVGEIASVGLISEI